MAWRRNQFQGQFGLHRTSLTSAIEEGNYKLAEEIIEGTSDPSFLNEGAYENMPLHMVLTNNHHTDNSRNLRLAKLLVQKGANANLRVPFIELDRASPSPFEELVIYHEMLKSFVEGKSEFICDELDMYFELPEVELKFITNTVNIEGVQCLPNIENCHELIKQTSDLISVFLGCGSDPNVLTTFGKTLFHWVAEHDVTLARRFLDTSRVNLNLCDVHGSSPLMDAILRNDPEETLSLFEAMCDTVSYIDVNLKNCCGETALFRAMFVGAVELAQRLCEKGACLEMTVSLAVIPTKDEGICGTILRNLPPFKTPLLAPLLTDAPAGVRYTHVPARESGTKHLMHPHKHLIDKVISSSISPLIDNGSLNNQTVASHIATFLPYGTFRELIGGEIQNTDLITLMFGQVSAGLRQLCIRSIFDKAVMPPHTPYSIWPHLRFKIFSSAVSCEVPLTPSDIEQLVSVLGLPQPFKILFEIEAAKYQICRVVMTQQSIDCDQDCSASDESMFDAEDDDDDNGDTEDSSELYECDSMTPSDFSLDTSESFSDEGDEEESSDSEETDESSARGVDTEAAEVDGRTKKDVSETLNSGSVAVVDVLGLLQEDAAEGKLRETYQRFKDESTSSSLESAEDCTVSEPPSDSSC